MEFPLDSKGSCATFASRETTSTALILLCKHDLLRLGLILYMDSNTLRGPAGLIPLVSQRGHLFVLWEQATFESYFPQAELTKLHVRTGHVGWQKLHAFFKRACPSKLTDKTRKKLEAMQKSCKACTKVSSAPRIFTARIPHDRISFNS